MARESYAQTQIPTGVQSVPYPDHRAVIASQPHATESFAAQLLGAGGVGDALVCPFEPAEIEIYVPATPLAQKTLPGSAGPVHVNLITGAAAAASPTVTPVDPNDKSQGYTVDVPVAILPDAAVGHVICRGYRDVNGGL